MYICTVIGISWETGFSVLLAYFYIAYYILFVMIASKCIRFKNNLNFIHVKLVHLDPVNILL